MRAIEYVVGGIFVLIGIYLVTQQQRTKDILDTTATGTVSIIKALQAR